MKYISLPIAVIFAFSTLFIAPEKARASDLTTGLVSCWSFDEASGTRVDAYGDNDLSPTNAPGNSATSKFGNSLDLERSSSQYLSITDASQVGLDLGSGGTNFAVGGWVRLESNNFHTLIAKYQNTNQFSYQLRMFPDATDETWVDGSGNGSTVFQRGQNQPGVTNWTINTWYFLIYEYDAGAGTVYVSLNDQTAQSDSGYPTSLFNGTAPFTVGVGLFAGAEYYDGLMDEWFVYNRLLNDTEEAEIYNSGTGMSCDQIIATGVPPEATTTPFMRFQGDVQMSGDVIFRR